MRYTTLPPIPDDLAGVDEQAREDILALEEDVADILQDLIEHDTRLDQIEAAAGGGIALPFNASTATTFPSTYNQAGYRVTNAGTVQSVSLDVGDVIYPLSLTPAAQASSWYVVEGNASQATTAAMGLVQLALLNDYNAGNGSKALTAELVKPIIDGIATRVSTLEQKVATLEANPGGGGTGTGDITFAEFQQVAHIIRPTAREVFFNPTAGINGNGNYKQPINSATSLQTWLNSLTASEYPTIRLERGKISPIRNLTLPKPGRDELAEVLISDYGDALLPATLSGGENLKTKTWTSAGNIWSTAQATAPYVLYRDGISMPRARIDAFQAVNVTNTTGQFPTITAPSSINYADSFLVGKRIYIRATQYNYDTRLITAWNNTTKVMTLSGAPGGTINNFAFSPSSNAWMYIDNDASFLNQQNEWFYDPATQQIKIFSTTTPASFGSLYASVAANGIFATHNGNGFNEANKIWPHIRIENVKFEYYGSSAIKLKGYYYDTAIRNCTFENIRKHGIDISSNSTYLAGKISERVTIENNTISKVGGHGIFTRDISDLLIKGNTIDVRGELDLYGLTDELEDDLPQKGCGIRASTRFFSGEDFLAKRIRILENTTKNTQSGIWPDGDDLEVAYNHISEFNKFTTDASGGYFNGGASVFSVICS